MKKEELEIYSTEVNYGIVKMPKRRFPGVVIQGDSLSKLLSQAMHLVERLENSANEDAFFEALDIAEKLEEHIKNYERS